MLVGSDYTVGLQGVGPVTALEIIAEFATNRIEEIGDPEELMIPLKRFRQWWQSKEMTNLRRKRLKNSLKELNFHEGSSRQVWAQLQCFKIFWLFSQDFLVKLLLTHTCTPK